MAAWARDVRGTTRELTWREGGGEGRGGEGREFNTHHELSCNSLGTSVIITDTIVMVLLILSLVWPIRL